MGRNHEKSATKLHDFFTVDKNLDVEEMFEDCVVWFAVGENPRQSTDSDYCKHGDRS